MNRASHLTAEHLARLRDQARADGRLVDPAALYRVRQAAFPADWATAILERPYPGWNHVHPWEIKLLDLALTAEPSPPPRPPIAGGTPAAASVRAAADALDTRAKLWAELRARLPIPVTVGHNWTIGHYDGYDTGKDHIVAQADLHIGRLRRAARQGLCETSAKTKLRSARNGLSLNPLRGVDRQDDGQDRLPSCAACLTIAERIARPERTDSAAAATRGVDGAR